jgi:TNF receptor-associated protein 1
MRSSVFRATRFLSTNGRFPKRHAGIASRFPKRHAGIANSNIQPISFLLSNNYRCNFFSTNTNITFQEKKEAVEAEVLNKKEEEDIVVDENEEESKKLKREGLIEETEQIIGQKESKEFQAETKQLLNIVATALYTDKEVFIRELISNASDALEKVRQFMITNSNVEDKDKDLNIKISVDEENRTFTIQDTGIGMEKDELIENIGTIAHSGSKAFVNKLKESAAQGSDAVRNIIGQFGVGFYSVFMVADKVKIYTRHAREGSQGYCWESHGEGTYTISEAEGVARGTKIILYLKDNEREFSFKETVERIIKKYSNFVSYKIFLNGHRVNTLDAIWLKSKNDVTEEEHKEFFNYLSQGSGGDPLYIIQFSTDIPLSIHSLFYVPKTHTEMFGMGKVEPGVNVYSRKVLIKAKHREILPDWLRFLKGAVDSEDLPLNISREHLQDSPLIRRINGILTRRILKFFGDMMKEDRAKYTKFYDDFGKFFKEGISTDFLYKDELGKLLLFDSSAMKPGERTTLQEYVERMKEDQKNIFYIVSPTRSIAENSPYYEVFKKKGIEVIFSYNPADEFVMGSMGYFDGKEIKSIEKTELEQHEEEKSESLSLSEEQVKELGDWMKNILKGKIGSVKVTKRLSDTPAIIKNPENAAMRMIRKMQSQNAELPLDPQQLEINPKHPIIVKLYKARTIDEPTAITIAEQVFDNALISAGLLDDPRTMLNRLSKLLELSMKEIPLPVEEKAAQQQQQQQASQ